MSTADMVTETKIIHLYQKSLLVVQHSNMACLIPWVSKILSDLIDDFLRTLMSQTNLVDQKTLVDQHLNMACLIPWVSKILSDPIDDFLIPLNLFMATVFAITNLDSSLHNFEWVLDSRTVFAILEFSSHSFM